MCGMCGYIGISKNPDLSYKIATKLFNNTEVRGIDSSGFWGVNKKQQVLYHKEPVKSSLLTKKDVWKKVKEFNPNLLLLHTRLASAGVGHPKFNFNNHPFVSHDYNLALIHNGRIPEFEALSNKYNVISNCDSEILLRIIEAAYKKDVTVGIKDIFSIINKGHMAVAVGKKETDKTYLWLFRNKHRSLWLADLRDYLGQMFFCSTIDIWKKTMNNCGFNRRVKLTKLPEKQVWCFSLDDIKKYTVIYDKEYSKWQNDGNILKVKNKCKHEHLITELDENDELKDSTTAHVNAISIEMLLHRLRNKLYAKNFKETDLENIMYRLENLI